MREDMMDYQTITELLFTADIRNRELSYDCVLILGSRCCDYRVRQALKVKTDKYICSGGNYTVYTDGEGHPITEACYMKRVLLENGIKESRISADNRSRYSLQNLLNCREFIAENTKVGIVTAGFHAERLHRLMNETGYTAKIIPAYGPYTSPENWYMNEKGITVVCEELQKVYPERADELMAE